MLEAGASSISVTTLSQFEQQGLAWKQIQILGTDFLLEPQVFPGASEDGGRQDD